MKIWDRIKTGFKMCISNKGGCFFSPVSANIITKPVIQDIEVTNGTNNSTALLTLNVVIPAGNKTEYNFDVSLVNYQTRGLIENLASQAGSPTKVTKEGSNILKYVINRTHIPDNLIFTFIVKCNGQPMDYNVMWHHTNSKLVLANSSSSSNTKSIFTSMWTIGLGIIVFLLAALLFVVFIRAFRKNTYTPVEGDNVETDGLPISN